MIWNTRLFAVAAALAAYLVVPLASAQTTADIGAEGVKEIQLAADRFERGAPVPHWVDRVTALPATKDKSPLVTLLADIQFLAGTPQSFYAHRAWLVNGPSALEGLGRQSIEFNPAYQRVKLHALQVSRDGKTLDRMASANIRYLQRETGLEQGMYSGEASASILIDDLRVGDIVELEFTLEGANPVLGGKFIEAASWDAQNPIELRRVSVRYPAGRKIAWRFLGDLHRDAIKPEESTSGAFQKLQWEARALARTTLDAGIPNDFQPLRVIQLSEYGRWSDVTAWAGDLFRSTTALPDELQRFINRLDPTLTLDERVSAALGFVQNEVRYFSVSLGESSHRPSQPALTLQRRYGDCKDKSFLLIELLKALGVQAQPVLVSASSRRGISRLLPSPYAFDHVIVSAIVNGREYFLDSTRTGQTGKLDAMGQLWEGAEVLVVKPGNDAFTVIASPNQAALTRDELVEKIALATFGGDGTLEARRTWTGTGAEFRRVMFASWTPELLGKVAIEPYERRYPGVRAAAPATVEDDKVNNVLTLVQKLAVPKMAISAGGDWGVRYSAINFRGLLDMPPSATRTMPYALSSRRTHLYSVEVEFPPEVSRMADPTTRSVRDRNFQFSVSSSFRGNRAIASMELQVLNDTVEAARTAAYMDALRRTSDIDAAVFVVRKDDIKSTGLLGMGAPSLQRSLETRLADRIEKITKAIEGGRLTGEDLAQAYCDRAEAQVDIGRPAEGLRDGQQAVKLEPNVAAMYRCRGTSYMALGDYPHTIADYTKSITLEPDNTHAYYRRGHARFYSGQLAAAADDFAKAGIESKGDDEAKLYAELWRVWTQKRLGVQPGPAQVQLASAAPRGEWPRPALAMLHGIVSVDDVLIPLEQKKGDERDMVQAEAYFYVGQYYFMQGDKAKAADYFQRSREKGVIVYIEHQSAGIELDLLGMKK